MSFGMFATWLLVGVLAGVLAGLVLKRGGHGLKSDVFLGLAGSIGGSWIFRGLFYSGGGMLTGLVVAGIGAIIPVIAQRLMWPSERLGREKAAMWKWGLGLALVAAMLWMHLGPTAQPPAATAAVIEDKSYTVTPPSLRVKAGIVAGQVVDMKIMERVEKGSDRVVTRAKLTAILRLKNTSTNQTVHLITGKLQYVDSKGQPIKLEAAREPTVKFASSNSDRLDPGQETTEAMDVDVPAEALTAGTLKEIRLELAYITSPYREETVRFPVTIGRP
jgi:uncharacterized membrane protein YeaQ/YmgE (transglycosylase-associated protein family)